jgi:tetratricopeptide (TPR) repeat protein
MIVLGWLWISTGWLAPAIPSQESGPLPPKTEATEDPRIEVLRRDPRELRRADPDRWKDFGSAASAEPVAVPDGFRAALLAIRDRDLPTALVRLYRVLEAEPEYPPALYELGVVYFRMQRYGDGAAAMERFVAVAPTMVGNTRVLGHCYYSLGEHARAKEHYERVLAVAPREVEAIRGLALSELHLGAPDRADELLGKLLEIDPRHAEAWAWKSQVLLDLDRPEAALDAARRARELDPWQPRPWYLAGRILLDLGKEDEGRAAQDRYRLLSEAAQEANSLENRLEYSPHEIVLLRRLVEVHASIGNVPSVRRDLARLVVERPSDVDLRILALDVLERLADQEGSQLAADALAKRCPEEWRAWERLERYYGRIGKLQEMLQAGEKARRLRSE